MNRRSAIKYLVVVPLILRCTPVQAEDQWFYLGKRTLRPNLGTTSLAINSEVRGIAKLGIEVKGNAIWLYDVRVAGPGSKCSLHRVNFNIPPASGECSPHLTIAIDGRARQVELEFDCLPLTGKPTEILLWGAA